MKNIRKSWKSTFSIMHTRGSHKAHEEKRRKIADQQTFFFIFLRTYMRLWCAWWKRYFFHHFLMFFIVFNHVEIHNIWGLGKKNYRKEYILRHDSKPLSLLAAFVLCGKFRESGPAKKIVYKKVKILWIKSDNCLLSLRFIVRIVMWYYSLCPKY